MANIYTTKVEDIPEKLGDLPDKSPGSDRPLYPARIIDAKISSTDKVPDSGSLLTSSAAQGRVDFIFPIMSAAEAEEPDPADPPPQFEVRHATPPDENAPGPGFVIPPYAEFNKIASISLIAPVTYPIPATTVTLSQRLPEGPHFLVGVRIDPISGNATYTEVLTIWVDRTPPPDDGSTPEPLINAFDGTLTDAVIGGATSVAFTVPTYKGHKRGDKVEIRYGIPGTPQYDSETITVVVPEPGAAGTPIVIEVPAAFLLARGPGKYQIAYKLSDAPGNLGIHWSKTAALTSTIGGDIKLDPPVVVRAAVDNLVDRADAYQALGTEVTIPFNAAFVRGDHSFQLYIGVNGAAVAPIGDAFRYIGQTPIVGYLPAAALQALYDATGSKSSVPLIVEYALMLGTVELKRSPIRTTNLNLSYIGPVIDPPGGNENLNLNAPHLTGPVSLLADTLEAQDQGRSVTVTIVAWTAAPLPATQPFYLNLYFGTGSRPFRSALQTGIAPGATITIPNIPSTFFETAGNGSIPLRYTVTGPGSINESAFSPPTPIAVSGWSKRLGSLRFLNLANYAPPIISCPAQRVIDGKAVFTGVLETSQYFELGQVVSVRYVLSANQDGSGPIAGNPFFSEPIAPLTQPELTGGVPFSIPYSDISKLGNGWMTLVYSVEYNGETIQSPPYVIRVKTVFGGVGCAVVV